MDQTISTDMYQALLSDRTRAHWDKIGLKRRSGVAAPLFSLYSKQSTGVGEIPDLKLLIDWCLQTGLSILQLLPMNDVGYNFRPYDGESSFALEPLYIAPGRLRGVANDAYVNEVNKLKAQFPVGTGRVDYGIKQAKMDLLGRVFAELGEINEPAFEAFKQANAYWLTDYAVFKTLKEKMNGSSWENWPQAWKTRQPEAMEAFKQENRDRVQFQVWLQWQLAEQFRDVKTYAEDKGVFLMGDLPFLVSRDSADVWGHQDYFKVELCSGAPPDPYYANGQRWGMPAYRWDVIASQGYDYLAQKMRCAANYYDLYRIDHFVGLFRLWVIADSEPLENEGLNGHFDPSDEGFWEEHGKRILHVMLENTDMLPCAEDLGTVPACSYRVLEGYGIPGMDVQRWVRDWDATYDFKAGAGYRKHSLTTIATHDMAGLRAWWEFEAGRVDETLFKRMCSGRGLNLEEVKALLFDSAESSHGRLKWRAELKTVDQLVSALGRRAEELGDFISLFLSTVDEREKFLRYLGIKTDFKAVDAGELEARALRRSAETASIFNVQLLLDWLSIDGEFHYDTWHSRINFPGTLGDQNWTVTLPMPLEDLTRFQSNSKILKINQETGRI